MKDATKSTDADAASLTVPINLTLEECAALRELTWRAWQKAAKREMESSEKQESNLSQMYCGLFDKFQPSHSQPNG